MAKLAILTALQGLSGYPDFPQLKGVTVAIKETGITLTTTGVSFVIVLSKSGGTTQEIASGFTVKRTAIT